MDNENDIICDICHEAEASCSEHLEGQETDLCDSCFDTLPTDDWTGQLVREIHDTVNGYDLSYATFHNETQTCDWSGDRVFNEGIIELSNGDCIDRDQYEDEIGHCYDCSHTAHVDDLEWQDRVEAYTCDSCSESYRYTTDRWYHRFAKRVSNSFRHFPVRSYIGIEFEAEGGEAMESDMSADLRNAIAEAKDDGSLDSGGTEYVTHPMRGDDVATTIDAMCEQFANNGYTMSRNVGWHFHYEMESFSLNRQKNIWSAMQRFDSLVRMSPKEFRYFSAMQRSYACAWTDQYVSWASEWAMDKKVDYGYRQHRTRATRGSEMGRYAWMNWSPMANQDNRRIEIRLYQPIVYRQAFTDHSGWTRDAYKSTGEDYKMFIRFWNEFIRKAAYRPRGLKFRDESHSLLELSEFAEQFSPEVSGWMKANHGVSLERNTQH